MERLEFMIYTASSHQGAIKMLWLYFLAHLVLKVAVLVRGVTIGRDQGLTFNIHQSAKCRWISTLACNSLSY